jgi:hypothetical protein
MAGVTPWRSLAPQEPLKWLWGKLKTQEGSVKATPGQCPTPQVLPELLGIWRLPQLGDLKGKSAMSTCVQVVQVGADIRTQQGSSRNSQKRRISGPLSRWQTFLRGSGVRQWVEHGTWSSQRRIQIFLFACCIAGCRPGPVLTLMLTSICTELEKRTLWVQKEGCTQWSLVLSLVPGISSLTFGFLLFSFHQGSS